MAAHKMRKSVVGLTFGVILAVSACGGDSDLRPLTEGMLRTPSVSINEYPAALAPGELDVVVTDDRAYFLLITEFDTYGLIFTEEVYGREGEPVQLVHEDGSVIATVGDQVEIGGGEYPQGEGNWSGGPEVDQYWLAIVDDEGF